MTQNEKKQLESKKNKPRPREGEGEQKKYCFNALMMITLTIVVHWLDC